MWAFRERAAEQRQLPNNENLLRRKIACWRHLINEPYRMDRTLHNNWPLYHCLTETELYNMGLFDKKINCDK